MLRAGREETQYHHNKQQRRFRGVGGVVGRAWGGRHIITKRCVCGRWWEMPPSTMRWQAGEEEKGRDREGLPHTQKWKRLPMVGRRCWYTCLCRRVIYGR